MGIGLNPRSVDWYADISMFLSSFVILFFVSVSPSVSPCTHTHTHTLTDTFTHTHIHTHTHTFTHNFCFLHFLIFSSFLDVATFWFTIGKQSIREMPQLEPYWAAGFSFSRGHFKLRVPYDAYQPMVFQVRTVYSFVETLHDKNLLFLPFLTLPHSTTRTRSGSAKYLNVTHTSLLSSTVLDCDIALYTTVQPNVEGMHSLIHYHDKYFSHIGWGD